MRLFLALLASAATATFLAELIEMTTSYPPPENPFSWATIELFGFGLAGSGMLAALFGLPAFLIANRFRCANAWTSAIAGAAVGCLVSFLVLTVEPALLPDPYDPTPAKPIFEVVLSYLRYGGIGLVSGLTFWFVRDSKRQKKAPPADAF